MLPPFATFGLRKIEKGPLQGKSPESLMPIGMRMPHDVGRIDVAVQIDLDHAVHADASAMAHEFRMIRNFLRAQDDLVAISRNVAFENVVGRGA